MLGSPNLGPSVFWGFYCNFVKSGPVVTKFGTPVARERGLWYKHWLLLFLPINFFCMVCILCEIFIMLYIAQLYGV